MLYHLSYAAVVRESVGTIATGSASVNHRSVGRTGIIGPRSALTPPGGPK